MTATKNGRDYSGAIEEAKNAGLPVPENDWLTCAHCGRPAYYDSVDENYHHAVDATRGCFLIRDEDRPDDVDHPLVTDPFAGLDYHKGEIQ